MAKAPTVGELRHYITVQRPAVFVDEYGQTVRTWTTVADCLPARMTVKSHNSRDGGDKQTGWQETVFTIRSQDNLLDKDRIVYLGRYYAIHSIADVDGVRKWQDIRTELNTDRGELTS